MTELLMTKESLETVRIDRWLFAARFYKTRSQALKACEGGKVKIDGRSVKPHKFVRVGDHLTIHHHDRYRAVEILALAQRGLPPKEARLLYREEVKHSLIQENEELLNLFYKTEKKSRLKYKGRPTKKERRKLDNMKERFS
jgi:ribosome-associated heat shock protein Hsp15